MLDILRIPSAYENLPPFIFTSTERIKFDTREDDDWNTLEKSLGRIPNIRFHSGNFSWNHRSLVTLSNDDLDSFDRAWHADYMMYTCLKGGVDLPLNEYVEKLLSVRVYGDVYIFKMEPNRPDKLGSPKYLNMDKDFGRLMTKSGTIPQRIVRKLLDNLTKDTCEVVKIPCNHAVTNPICLTNISLTDIDISISTDNGRRLEERLVRVPNLRLHSLPKTFSWPHRLLTELSGDDLQPFAIEERLEYMMYMCMDKEAGLPLNRYLKTIYGVLVYGDAFIFKVKSDRLGKERGAKYLHFDEFFVRDAKLGRHAVDILDKLLNIASMHNYLKLARMPCGVSVTGPIYLQQIDLTGIGISTGACNELEAQLAHNLDIRACRSYFDWNHRTLVKVSSTKLGCIEKSDAGHLMYMRLIKESSLPPNQYLDSLLASSGLKIDEDASILKMEPDAHDELGRARYLHLNRVFGSFRDRELADHMEEVVREHLIAKIGVLRIPCDCSPKAPFCRTKLKLVRVGKEIDERECTAREKQLGYIPDARAWEPNTFSWYHREFLEISIRGLDLIPGAQPVDYMMYVCMDEKSGLPRNWYLESLFLGLTVVKVYGDAFIFKKEAESIGSSDSRVAKYLHQKEDFDVAMKETMFKDVLRKLLESSKKGKKGGTKEEKKEQKKEEKKEEKEEKEEEKKDDKEVEKEEDKKEEKEEKKEEEKKDDREVEKEEDKKEEKKGGTKEEKKEYNMKGKKEDKKERKIAGGYWVRRKR